MLNAHMSNEVVTTVKLGTTKLTGEGHLARMQMIMSLQGGQSGKELATKMAREFTAIRCDVRHV